MVWDLFHAFFFRVRFCVKVIIDGEEGEFREKSIGRLVLPQNVGHHQVMPGMKNGWVPEVFVLVFWCGDSRERWSTENPCTRYIQMMDYSFRTKPTIL